MSAEAFKELYLPYHHELYRLARRYLETEGDAEDVVQEVYIKLWNQREELCQIESPKAYCLTLTKHLCIEALRRDKSAQRHPIGEAHELPSNENLMQRIEVRNEAEVLTTIIDQLPHPYSQVITMRDVESCEFAEIEAATGLTPINVRTILSRARKRVRAEFNKRIKRL